MFQVLFISLLWVGVATGTWELELVPHSYRNPSGRCAGCRDSSNPGVPLCCDETLVRPLDQSCPQTQTCDTTVNICFRPVGSSGLNCNGGLFRGTQLLFDTNDILFQNNFFGRPIPDAVFSNTAWVGIQVFFIFLECGESTICDIIDTFPVDIRATVGTVSPAIEYVGSAGLARFNFTFEVRCAENFYGADCLTNCSSFESCGRCGLMGFTGEFCQHEFLSCREMFCSGNGACVDGDTSCVCDIGYTGDDCQSNIDDCNGVNCTAGECIDGINNFMCDCEPGFTGNFCQLSIDDCNATSCNGNGECIDGLNSFTCNCNAGFTGDFCAVDIDDCENVDCNNGQCIDEIDNFRCECSPNFSGEMCDEASPCIGVICSGNGVCIRSSESFTCACNAGFGGDLCQEEEASAAASSTEVGAIVGGVIGALIAAILFAIFVVALAIFVSKMKRSGSQLMANGVSQSPSDIFPGDNPAYGANDRKNNAYRVTIPLNETENNQRGHLPSTSTQERDFDNPIYAANDMMEEPYTTVEFENSSGNHYAVPSSIPATPSSITAPSGSNPTEPPADTQDERLYSIPSSLTADNVYEPMPEHAQRTTAISDSGSGVYSVVRT